MNSDPVRRRWTPIASAVILSAAGLLVPARPATACSCFGVAPCKAAWLVDAVFVGRVRAVETEDLTIEQRSFAVVRRVLLDVTERFRGDVGDNVVIAPGDDSCGFPFETGKSYVAYARRSIAGAWSTNLCSGTKETERAETDLSYLRSLTRPAGTHARLEGAVSVPPGVGSVLPPTAVRVTLRNGGRQIRIPVGSNGRIDARVPPGTYAVGALVPIGYYASVNVWPFDSAELVVPHVRACPSLSVSVGYDGHLTGRVVDAAGRGVPGVIVEAAPGTNAPYGTPSGTRTMTDGAGGYDLAHLPPGVYRVVVNIGWNGIHTRVRKPRVYHPGTTDSALAADISVGAGERVSVPTLRIPQQLALATLSGVVRDADGQRAAGVRVLVEEDASGHSPSVTPFLPGGSKGYATTDDTGRFTITGLAGERYRVMAERQTRVKNSSGGVSDVTVDRALLIGVEAGPASASLVLTLERVPFR